MTPILGRLLTPTKNLRSVFERRNNDTQTLIVDQKLIIQYSLFVMHYAVCIMQYALYDVYYAVCIMQYAYCSMHYAVCIMLYALGSIHCSMQYALCSMRYAVCIMHVFSLIFLIKKGLRCVHVISVTKFYMVQQFVWFLMWLHILFISLPIDKP